MVKGDFSNFKGNSFYIIGLAVFSNLMCLTHYWKNDIIESPQKIN